MFIAGGTYTGQKEMAAHEKLLIFKVLSMVCAAVKPFRR
jgi:hypothetical protein